MTSVTDVANRALQTIGTRSQIASLQEQSNEAINCNLLIDTTRQQLLRMAPWNCATNYNNLALICAAPGTPENPTTGVTLWEKGIPAPPWTYEYAYPADCLRPLWIVPQFNTGFVGVVPITTAVTGYQAMFWTGPPVKFKVSIDQLVNGVPAVGGVDTKVILTNQEFAILCYIKNITDPGIMDEQFIEGWVELLGSRLAIALTGDKALANQKIQNANSAIQIARTGDGNEGLTVNDVTPDWIRIRGIDFSGNCGWSPNQYDWGSYLPGY